MVGCFTWCSSLFHTFEYTPNYTKNAYTKYMNLHSYVQAVRAIGVVFVKRLALPVLSIVGITLLVSLAVTFWLTSLSGWWWLLLAPLLLLTVLGVFAGVIGGIILRLLTPLQTKQQKQQVHQFVDNLQTTSEAVQTPFFILLFRIMKDVLFPGKESYIGTLSTSAGSLKTSFQTIVQSFQAKS